MELEIKVRLGESNLNLLRRIEEKTSTNYEIDRDGWITLENIFSAIENLESELDHSEEKFKDFVNDVNDNYKRVSVEEQYEISDRDFI